MKEEKPKAKLHAGMERAIYERMVTMVGGRHLALEWGSLPGSLGYQTAVGQYEREPHLLSFEEWKAAILLQWLYHMKEREYRKRTMKEVLGDMGADEERRPVYRRMQRAMGKEASERIQHGTPELLKEKKAELSKAITCVEDAFAAITEQARARLDGTGGDDLDKVFPTEEAYKELMASIQTMESISEGLRWQEGAMDFGADDMDAFLEGTLKPAKRMLEEAERAEKGLNEFMENVIRARMDARYPYDEADEKTRRKTFLDRFMDCDWKRVSEYDLEKGLVGIKSWYAIHKEDFDTTIEFILEFMEIEATCNLCFYGTVCEGLMDLPVKEFEAMRSILLELAACNPFLFFVDVESVTNVFKTNCDEKQEFLHLMEQMLPLMEQTNSIVRDVLDIRRFPSKIEMQKLDERPEVAQIAGRVERCLNDLYDERTVEKKFFKFLKKMLMENNTVLRKRSWFFYKNPHMTHPRER